MDHRDATDEGRDLDPRLEHVRAIIDEIEDADESETPPGDHGARSAESLLGLRGHFGRRLEGVDEGDERADDTEMPEAHPDDGIEVAVRRILVEIGEDPDRQGLRRTPERMHRMHHELTAGYHVDPDRLINGALFSVDYSEMVVVRGIEFHSLCEHHLLPFFGTAAVGYLPRGRVIGLSKIPRIVEMYARRLQVQERMTQQIADFLQDRLNPYGVGDVIEAEHLCMAMRGVRKGGATMVTSAVLGSFRSSQRTREEFMAHLERGRDLR